MAWLCYVFWGEGRRGGGLRAPDASLPFSHLLYYCRYVVKSTWLQLIYFVFRRERSCRQCAPCVRVLRVLLSESQQGWWYIYMNVRPGLEENRGALQRS